MQINIVKYHLTLIEKVKIRKSTIQSYKYQVGRDNRGYWSVCHTLGDAIKLWFEYL